MEVIKMDTSRNTDHFTTNSRPTSARNVPIIKSALRSLTGTGKNETEAVLSGNVMSNSDIESGNMLLKIKTDANKDSVSIVNTES